MDSKRKMIIAICAFAMVLLATVVAVVAVLAAQNVTVSGSVKVTYTSSQKAAVVTAKYKVGDSGTLTNLGDGTATFSGAESGADSTKDLTTSAAQISLNTDQNYVEFEFTFTNPGSSDYTAALTLPATSSGFTVTYTQASGTGVSNATDTSFILAGGTTTPVTYKVKYTISNLANDASPDGTFEWTLS